MGMSFYQGTTPTMVFRFHEVNPSLAEKIVLTFTQDKSKWIFTESDVTTDETTVTILLTQQQTLAFKPGAIEAMLNFLFPDGSRFATNPKDFKVKKNEYDEVM